ncbi:MAG: ABC transporter permease [Deltaproteobacteria bacterium]|nr:MAG: ABC transporter permease [Deltaproteobacteria bacterium]
MTVKPDITRRFFKVWYRNLVVYRRVWVMDFLLPVLEPIFYLLAFGVGLGALVHEIVYRGEEISYVTFIAPSLLAINIMYHAFFENTYASFVRMHYQKTYDAMLATPLSLDEVVLGEILWGTTKAVLATLLMGTVIALFGLLEFPSSFLLVPLSFLGGLLFGAMGMVFTAILPTIDSFNLPVFLIITPMFLFSDTFFPVDALPEWARVVAEFLPLYHLTKLSRDVCLDHLNRSLLFNLAYLTAVSLFLTWVAIILMRRRLIK